MDQGGPWAVISPQYSLCVRGDILGEENLPYTPQIMAGGDSLFHLHMSISFPASYSTPPQTQTYTHSMF